LQLVVFHLSLSNKVSLFEILGILGVASFACNKVALSLFQAFGGSQSCADLIG